MNFSSSETSVLDYYLQACSSACRDPSEFKRNPAYAGIVQNVNVTQGQDCINHVLLIHPGMLSDEKAMSKILEFDAKGDPSKETFQMGTAKTLTISPTMARYLKEVATLRVLFGDQLLQSCTVVEIGGGYGGLRTVLEIFAPPKHYYVVDLPIACKLHHICLNDTLKTRTTFVTTEELGATPSPAHVTTFKETLLSLSTPISSVKETVATTTAVAHASTTTPISSTTSPILVISNYAFSECSVAVRANYLNTIIRHAKYGYFTINHLSTTDRDALLAEFKRHQPRQFHMDKDITGKHNLIVSFKPAIRFQKRSLVSSTQPSSLKKK